MTNSSQLFVAAMNAVEVRMVQHEEAIRARVYSDYTTSIIAGKQNIKKYLTGAKLNEIILSSPHSLHHPKNKPDNVIPPESRSRRCRQPGHSHHPCSPRLQAIPPHLQPSHQIQRWFLITFSTSSSVITGIPSNLLSTPITLKSLPYSSPPKIPERKNPIIAGPITFLSPLANFA